ARFTSQLRACEQRVPDRSRGDVIRGSRLIEEIRSRRGMIVGVEGHRVARTVDRTGIHILVFLAVRREARTIADADPAMEFVRDRGVGGVDARTGKVDVRVAEEGGN